MTRSAYSLFLFLLILHPSFQQNTFAQPFPCDNGQRLYFFRNNGGNGTLSYVQNYTTNPSVVNLCNIPTPNHNGLAGNPLDGYLYYMSNNVLLRLSASCTVTPVCTLPFATNVGGFDPLGRYWTLDGTNLVAIDINTCSVVKGPYPVSPTGIVDLAFNPYDCYMYIGDQRFDTTGTVDPTYTGPPTNSFVGAAVGSDGNLYAISAPGFFSNTSTLVSINPNTGVTSQVMNINPGSPQTGGGDMANFPCFEPQALFQFSLSGCQPVTVNFQDSTSGPTGTWTYEWNFGDPASGAANTASGPDPSHIYSTPGTYTVQLIVNLTTTGYCLGGTYTDTLFQNITIPAPLVTNTPTSTPVSCFTGNDGTASVTATSGTGPYAYQWSPTGGTGSTANGLTAGTYTVTVTDANGCSSTVPVSVTQPTPVGPITPASPIGTVAVTCSGGNNGSATTAITGGTPPYSYQWSGGTANGNQVSGLAAGNYQLTVTDANGCTYSSGFTITEPTPLNTSITPPAPICAGQSATVTTAVQGGNGPYQYLWSDGSTGSSLTVSPAQTATYAVTITDANGCTSTVPLNATVDVLSAIAVITNPPVAICMYEEAILVAPAGMTNYVWNLPVAIGTNPPAYTDDSLVVSALPGTAQNYSVSFISTNGCPGTATYQVSLNNFTLAPVPATAICLGSTATLNAQSGLTSYDWSPATSLNANNVANPTASPTSTTTYSLIGTDANGCMDTVTTTITVNELTLAPIPDQVYCEGGSATLNAQSGLSAYNWSPATGLSYNGVANPVAAPTSSTTYTLIATDANGCNDTITTTVTVNQLTLSPIPDQAYCEGASATLNAQPGLNSYSWNPSTTLSSNGISNPVASPTSTTTYTLIATDANGCNDTVTTTVNVNQLTLSPIPDQVYCEGGSATLNAQTGLSAYNWSPATGLSSSGIANPVAAPASSTTYTLIATDANGCYDTITTTVTVNQLTLSPIPDQVYCEGGSAMLNAQAGLSAYNWSPTTGLSSSSIANPVASPTSTTAYTLIATDANGCNDTIITTVTVNQLTLSPIPDQVYCEGGSATLNAQTGLNAYNWSPATGLSSNGIANPIASPTSTTTYTLIATDANGCNDTITTTVTVNQLTLSPIPDQVYCEGGSAMLNAQAGLNSYNWSPVTGLNSNGIANPIASPTSSATYTLIATDANGCNDTVTTTVTVNQLTLSPIPDQVYCEGGSAALNAQTGLSAYNWSPATGLSSNGIANPIASPTSSTTYTLIATDANGCNDTTTTTVTVNGLTLTTIPNSVFCEGGSASLNAQTGLSAYNWSPSAGLSANNIANPVASPTTTTTYTLIATDANGCNDTATTTVTVNSLQLNATPSASVCNGFTANLSATPGLASYSWSPATGLSATNIPNPIANPSTTTTYTLIATDANGCRDTAYSIVTVNDLSVSAAANQPVCLGNSVALNGTPGLVSYAWSPTTGLSASNIANPSATPMVTTTYSVIATDANGCTGTASTTITVNQLTLPPIPGSVFCEGGSATLNAPAGLSSYNWSPSAGLSATSTANPVASPTSSTTYTLIATDANGCIDTTTTTITVNSLQLTATPSASVCNGFTANLSATPGLASYSWTPAAGLSSTTIANPIANPTTTTTYTLVATDANGCRDTAYSTVSVNGLTVVSAPNQPVCLGGSLSLNATPGLVSYSWTPATGLSASNIANPSATPATTTTYSVIATDANGCTGTASTTITVNQLTLAPIPNLAICEGSSATLNAPTGLSVYNWSPAAGLSSNTIFNPVASPTSTTTYTLTATDANGCSDTVTTTLTVNSILLSATPSASVCNGFSTTLNATPGLSSYSWSPASGLSATNIANPVANPSTTTSYTLIATDANGCTDTAYSVVTVNGLTIIASANQSVCLGGSVPLSVTPGLTSYSWSPATGLSATNLANPSATPNTTTTYTVTATDANGCTGSASTTITVDSLSLFATPSASVCNGFLANLTSTPGLVTYAWSPATGLNATNIYNPVANPSTSTTYTLVATDANGCSDTAFSIVTVNGLAVAAGADQSVCLGGFVPLNATPGLVSYSWTPSGSLSSGASANPNASPTTTTTYTVVATDINGCTGTASTTVTVNSLNLAPISADSICPGQSTTLSAQGGLTNYSWSPAAGLSSSGIQNPSASPTSTTIYSLVGTDINGCVDSVSTTVSVYNPIITASADTMVCIGGTASLSASSGFAAYQWTPTVGLNAYNMPIVYASPDSGITYSVTATDANGCTASASISIAVNTLNLFAFPDTGICPGESVQLQSTTGLASYQWSPAIGLSASNVSDPIASPTQTRNYTVVATDSNGCSNSATLTVTVYDRPDADFSFTPEEPSLNTPLVNFIDQSDNPSAWWWNFGDGTTGSQDQSPAHTYDSAGTYAIQLTVANVYGCRDSITKLIRIKSNYSFWLPNAFSPNNDEVNEFYKAEAFNIQFEQLMVFNRFGEVLFTSNRLEEGWDGNYLGAPAQEGTYVCLVRYRDPDNMSHEISKAFSLVR